MKEPISIKKAPVTDWELGQEACPLTDKKERYTWGSGFIEGWRRAFKRHKKELEDEIAALKHDKAHLQNVVDSLLPKRTEPSVFSTEQQVPYYAPTEDCGCPLNTACFNTACPRRPKVTV